MAIFRTALLGASIAVAVASFASVGQAASKIVDGEVSSTGNSISECARQFTGQPLINCVGDALNGFASGINAGDVSQVAPQAVPTARQAATVRGQPKAAALTTLNRVISISQGLAAKSSGEAAQVYTSLSRAFARAKSAIERKG